MKHCPNCQFDISETRSRVPNSKNKKVIVCGLCGFPVSEKHRKLLKIVDSIAMTLVFLLPTIAVILSIFIFSHPWWIVALIGVISFIFFLIILNNANFFLFDDALVKKYNKMSQDDFDKLVESDDRLISKRAVRMGFTKKIERYENYQKQTEEKMNLIKLSMSTADRLINTSKRKHLTKSDYDELRNHLTKIYIFSELPYNQLLNDEISAWSENDVYSNYLEEVEKFIEYIANKPRITVSTQNANNLMDIAQEMEEELAIVEKRSSELQKLLDSRNDAYLKLSNALNKMNKVFSKLFMKNIFTKDEVLFCLTQEEKAFNSMLDYKKHQDYLKINLSLDATYAENLSSDKPLMEFVNEFLLPEDLSDFWSAIEEVNKLIESVKNRPDDYGQKKDLEALGH